MGRSAQQTKHENAQKISSKISPNSSPHFSPRLPPESKKFVAAISLWGMSGITCVAVVSRYTLNPKGPCLTRGASTAGLACCTPSCLSKGVALQGGVAATLASVGLHCATMTQPTVTVTILATTKESSISAVLKLEVEGATS